MPLSKAVENDLRKIKDLGASRLQQLFNILKQEKEYVNKQLKTYQELEARRADTLGPMEKMGFASLKLQYPKFEDIKRYQSYLRENIKKIQELLYPKAEKKAERKEKKSKEPNLETKEPRAATNPALSESAISESEPTRRNLSKDIRVLTIWKSLTLQFDEAHNPFTPKKRPATKKHPLHPKITKSDLQPDEFLLSEAEKGYVAKKVAELKKDKKPLTKFSRKESGGQLKYSVIFDETGRAYALYKGKENKALGAGAYGRVKLAQDIETGEWFAVKIQKYEKRSTTYAKIAKAEHDRLAEFGRLKGKMTREKVEIKKSKEGKEDKAGKEIKETYEKLYLLMPLIPGENLNDYIDSLKESNEEINREKFKIAIAIAEKLKTFLHDKNIIHRDFKLANIMYNPETKEVEIIDLAEAVKLHQSDGVYSGSRGISTYPAPEIGEIFWDKDTKAWRWKWQSPCMYSKQSDIYALGKAFEQLKLVENLPGPIQSDLKALIKSMKNPDPYKRPNTMDIIKNLYNLEISYVESLIRKPTP